MKHNVLLLAFAVLLSGETFPAKSRSLSGPNARGTIEINDQGIAYSANNRKQNLRFAWLDIQYFDRVSPNEFVVLTYKDQRLLLGRDRQYRFFITQGELFDALSAMISNHLKRPLTDLVPPARVAPVYTRPVNSIAGWAVPKASSSSPTTRSFTWPKQKRRTNLVHGGDIVTAWSDDPYRLKIRAYDTNRRELSRTARSQVRSEREPRPGVLSLAEAHTIRSSLLRRVRSRIIFR